MVYTIEEKVKIIEWHFAGNAAPQVVELFIVAFQNRPVPDASTISRIVNTFRTTGCVNTYHKKKLNQPRIHQQTEDAEMQEILILARIQQDPTLSCHDLAEELDIDKTKVFRVLKKHKYHSYKLAHTQEIFEDDKINRMEFCETVMEMANRNERFIGNILFTDESTFHLQGRHNPSVVRYWSQENEHQSIPLRTQYPQKLNVWAGILGDHVIGPFFIDGTLNGQKYLDLLQNQVLPAVRNIPDIEMDNVWFQQDGCPAHNSAHNLLNEIFADRTISLRGNIRWPPRSPDLTPLDFFFWGFLKQTIYGHQHQRATNLQELQEIIINVSQTVTPVMLANVRQNFYDRLGYCLAREGDIFEPLL